MWDSTAAQMVERFKDTGQPVFKSIRALSRGILKKKKWQRHHTLQCGCFEHRTLLCKPAQYLRSSYELVRKIRLDRGRKRKIKTERIRDQRCIVKCETTRSKTFGVSSKASIWKQCARKHSGLPFAERDNSIHKCLRTCIVPALGISWDELQNST